MYCHPRENELKSRNLKLDFPEHDFKQGKTDFIDKSANKNVPFSENRNAPFSANKNVPFSENRNAPFSANKNVPFSENRNVLFQRHIIWRIRE